MDNKTKDFIVAMAWQFRAGQEIIASLNSDSRVWVEANNAILRDVLSFKSEAKQHFGAEFDEKRFEYICKI